MLSRLLNDIFAASISFLVTFQMTSSVISEKMFKMTRRKKLCLLDPVHRLLDPFLYHVHTVFRGTYSLFNFCDYRLKAG